MNKRSSKVSVPMIGATSLLVIFAVLCMTIFALLGLSSVRADKYLSDVRTDTVSAYYAADCRAEEILAQLKGGTQPQGVTIKDGIYRYSCPISATQELQVAIHSADWKILCWQAVTTASWQADDSIAVWDGSADSED